MHSLVSIHIQPLSPSRYKLLQFILVARMHALPFIRISLSLYSSSIQVPHRYVTNTSSSSRLCGENRSSRVCGCTWWAGVCLCPCFCHHSPRLSAGHHVTLYNPPLQRRGTRTPPLPSLRTPLYPPLVALPGVTVSRGVDITGHDSRNGHDTTAQ